ncbi:MAG: 50S ribosomal protein L22 [Candidatus Ranarchaeia archaeon]
MPSFKYSIIGLDPDKTAKASGRDLRVSPKDTREVCKALKGKMLDEAKDYLNAIIEKKQIVPFYRHKKHVGHHKAVPKWYTGRYPVNSAKAILNILGNAESNAEFKGLDIDRLRIIHICAQRGRKLKRFMPRAFGRASPKTKPLSHVEVVVEEQ